MTQVPVRRLLGHAGALVLVYLGVMVVVGTGGVFSSDEGAALAQAEALADHQTWAVPHPAPDIDPAGEWFPYEKSEAVGDGFAPLPRHPLWSLTVAGGMAALGVAGATLISILGAAAAALGAGVLAERIRAGTGAWALWVAGLATPLAFDSTLVLGHALAAGLVVWVLVLVVPRPRSVPGFLAAAVLMVAAVQLRREATLFGLAIAAVAAVEALRRRRFSTAVWGGLLGAVALAAEVGRAWWERAVFGSDAVSGVVASAPSTGGGGGGGGSLLDWLGGRIESTTTVLVRPSYEPAGIGVMLTVLIALLGAVLVVAIRRRDAELSRFSGIALVAAAIAKVVVGGPTPDIVPGLFVAGPAALWLLMNLDRDAVRRPEPRWLLGASAIFILAVLATQYEEAGAFEWGGRYLALALPAVVAATVPFAVRTLGRLEEPARRVAVVAVAAGAAAMLMVGVRGQRDARSLTDELVHRVADQASEQAPDDRALVVTTDRGLARQAWRVTDEQRWLRVPVAELSVALDRLEGAGEDQFVLATLDGAEAGAVATDAGWTAAQPPPPAAAEGWWITEVRR